MWRRWLVGKVEDKELYMEILREAVSVVVPVVMVVLLLHVMAVSFLLESILYKPEGFERSPLYKTFKNMQGKSILFIMLIGLFWSCQTPVTQNKIETIKVNLTQAELKLSGVFSDVELVKLETTDNSLLSMISKSYLGDSLIFISSAHELFLFKRSGEFVNKISRIGNGPEEYVRLSDFDVNEAMGEVYILDKSQQRIVVYNYDGEYLNTYPVGFWAIKVIKERNDELFLYSGNEESPSNDYKINIMKTSSINDKLFQIDNRKKSYLHVNSTQNFYWNDGMLYFFEAFNDTIYNLTKGAPHYYISYDGATPDSFFDRDFQNIMSFFQEFNKANYVNSTYNAFESDDSFFFSCFYSGVKYFNVYNKDGKSCSSFNTITEDVLFNNYKLPFINDDFNFWINRKNEVTYYISAQQAIENIDIIQNQKIKQIITDLNEDDNPVAIFCKLK